MHCQACSTVAFVAGRPVVAPVAGRSCEYHEEALGATGCLTAAATRTTPAVGELMESDLENAGQPGPRAERVAAEEEANRIEAERIAAEKEAEAKRIADD